MATVFLLGPSGLDAPRRVYAGLMSKMRHSPTAAPVVGMGISGESGKLALHLLLQNQDATLDETLLKSQVDPFEFSLKQIVTGSIVAAARSAWGGDCLGYRQPGGVTGTFGCLVKDLGGGGFLLSCNQRIARTSALAFGSPRCEGLPDTPVITNLIPGTARRWG